MKHDYVGMDALLGLAAILAIVVGAECVCAPTIGVAFNVTTEKTHLKKLRPEVWIGIIERLFFGVAIDLNLSAVTAAMVAWTAVKAQTH